VISLDLLRTFLVAAEEGSFRKAAAARFVTISAVSQQMKALEAQLRLPLFERLGRRVRLTAEGERLAASLRQAFAQVDDALAELETDHRALAGVVRVGTPRTFGRHWLRPRLAALLAAHPDLSVRVTFGVPSLLERRLSEGHLDAAILVREAELPAIETREIAEESFLAVASPRYLANAGAPRSEDDFRALRYGVFDLDLAMHAPWWRAQFGPRSPLPERIVAEIPDLEELLALAASGVCVTVLPSYLVDDRVRAGDLVVLAARRREVKNAIHLAWRRGAVLAARVKALHEALLR
jgi:DNA-binding transcriptional LysR family regulator